MRGEYSAKYTYAADIFAIHVCMRYGRTHFFLFALLFYASQFSVSVDCVSSFAAPFPIIYRGEHDAFLGRCISTGNLTFETDVVAHSNVYASSHRLDGRTTMPCCGCITGVIAYIHGTPFCKTKK